MGDLARKCRSTGSMRANPKGLGVASKEQQQTNCSFLAMDHIHDYALLVSGRALHGTRHGAWVLLSLTCYRHI